VWLRGLRYGNWTNVKPAVWWYAWKDGFKGARADLLRNALAPVALFDREYDDLGIAPYREKTLPSLHAGERVRRTLILYNDDFRDEQVRAEVLLRSGGKALESIAETFRVPLGEHIHIETEFNVPDAPTFDLVLKTSKGGKQRFEEARSFVVASAVTPARTPMSLRRAPQPGNWVLERGKWTSVARGAETARVPCDDTECVSVGPWVDGSGPARWEYGTAIPVTNGIVFGRYRTENLLPKQAQVRIEFLGAGKTLATRSYSLAASPSPFWGSFDIPVFRPPTGADAIKVSVGLSEKAEGRVVFTDVRVTRDYYGRGFREPGLLTRAAPPNQLRSAKYVRVHKDKNTWWLVKPDGTPFFTSGTLTPPSTAAEPAKVAAAMQHLGFDSLAGSHSLKRYAEWNSTAEKPMWQFRTIEVNVERDYATLLDAKGNNPGTPSAQAKARGGFNHAFADPYDPAFAKAVREQVISYLSDVKGKPYFAGWFAGNEREHRELHRYVYSKYASAEFVKFLTAQYDNIGALNAKWGTTFSSFGDILVSKPDPVRRRGAMYEDFRAFSRQLLKRYNGIFLDTIHELDPGRLVISNRFMVGEQRDVLDNLDCYDGFDIIAVNIYPLNTAHGLAPDERAFLRAVHERTGKPILIGEWSVPALDSGLYDNPKRLDWSYPQTVGTQTERANQVAQILTDLYNLPFVIGSHWFTWSDFDSPVRQANRGLFKASGEPWIEVQDALRRVHERIRARQ
jgi:hypothetical protein